MCKLRTAIGALEMIALSLVLSTWLSPVCAQSWQMQSRAIPVVVENTACNSAGNVLGMTASPAKLLICQSGVWTRQGTDAVISPLYLRNGITAPALCPATWTQVDLGYVSESNSNANYVRTCLPPASKTCSVVYFKNLATAPASCPALWTQADLGFVYESTAGGNYIRSCISCE